MNPVNVNPYLQTKILTASPDQLRLMLYDGAIKFCHQARKAIEDMSPGMALVINARGDLGAGVIGYILVAWLQERGVTAAVRDGPVRDAFEVTAGSPSVFCAGSTGPAA